MVKYDGAITVFSPDGHLFQVEYAQEAVKKGGTAVGIRGATCIVLGVEKKALAKLQDNRMGQKLGLVDDHVAIASAGLTSDCRVLMMNARRECKSYRLTLEDAPTVDHVARMIANMKQVNTQSTGRRPYGISWLIAGFNLDGTPKLFQTDPSGTHYEWTANAIGKNHKSVREFLEKTYHATVVDTKEATIKLAVKALMEVIQSGSKGMDIAVMEYKKPEKPGDKFTVWTILEQEEVDKYVKEIEKEKEEDGERRRLKKEGQTTSAS
jgi:20S proteasome subunit alpha 4